MEAACASSGSAFFHAVSAVAAGLYEVVLVAGVEKMTSQPTARVTEILASAGDCSGEIKAGSTFPSLFAMIARRHMYQFGTTREHLAAVAVKNHANGALNPDAHMRKAITMEQALNGRPVAEPLGLYDCSLISDGAAAVAVTSLERARDFTDKPVRVLGIAQASDYVALDQKQDITTFPAVRKAAEKAFAMAGLSAKDIQFAELHDCFTIAEIIAMEDLGFVKRGEGGPYTAAGHTALHGELPINTSGGLEIERAPGGGYRRRADLRSGRADPLRGWRAAGKAARARPGAKSGRLGRHLRGKHFGERMTGIVYTETVVHLAPEAFAKDVPYQVVIVTLENGSRVTARIKGERVAIDDRVEEAEVRDGVPFFRKSA